MKVVADISGFRKIIEVESLNNRKPPASIWIAVLPKFTKYSKTVIEPAVRNIELKLIGFDEALTPVYSTTLDEVINHGNREL